MPRTASKTIVTAIAGDKETLAAARLENLKKAREKALELRLLRNKQQPATAPPVTNKTRKRIQPEPVPAKPIDDQLVPTMAAPEENAAGQSSGSGQVPKPKRGRPLGSTKRKQPEVSVETNHTPADSERAVEPGLEKPEGPGKLLHRGSGEGDAATTHPEPTEQQSPKTPPGNVSNVQVAAAPPSVEEGELDASPPPPTELPRGRSKNNRRKPTTVKRTRTRGPSVESVRRKLNFDRMHVPVGGGAFYRNNASGHFTFSR